ncbi:hypothetical protein KDA_68820 [Dictyobacter alpinus]|uniref:DnaJ homologue subfamily C member 28 conserved domain-containing protein n=1 Tax=Dictyobacter alpinus TaxID=2014873 RepID=A0A402BJ30_9CHLR|nr:DUF1992 domain-containing protein [Dictyobacter alpinus]GCE31398.1 hypothetical protein KDA_68820 [Dictyobacter alpinus]
MDFVDWRKLTPAERARAQRTQDEEEEQKNAAIRFHGIADYLIQKAQNAGQFDNLPGAGKPFQREALETNGFDALASNILKSIGAEPVEISLQKEIQRKTAQIEKHLAYLQHRLNYIQTLSKAKYRGRIRAYQREVHVYEKHYTKLLKEINSRTLSLNIMAPTLMHIHPLPIEQLLKEYREQFYVFDEE